MSFIHIRLIRITNNENKATYLVKSTDFQETENIDHNWVELGVLEITKTPGNYSFTPYPLWSNTCGYPKEFFNSNQCAEFYDGLGSGSWAKVIIGYAKQFIEKDTFPLCHPPIFCD